MSGIDLQTPVLDDNLQNTYFFNGRVLTAEALQNEQQVSQQHRQLLGQALGEGVVYGLNVALVSSSTSQVTITGGLAINRRGVVLSLAQGVTLNLDSSTGNGSSSTQSAGPAFVDCSELPTGNTYLPGEGTFVLAISPASDFQESVPVVGFGSAGVANECGARYIAQGVMFRLIEVNLDSVRTLLTSLGSGSDKKTRNKRRNALAHLFLGHQEAPSFYENFYDDHVSPRTTPLSYGPLDDMRPDQLRWCDVPLALIYQNAGSIDLLDIWAVRRRLALGIDNGLPGVAAERHMAEAEATFLQFQAQIAGLTSNQLQSALNTIEARDYFQYLPPVGVIPISKSQSYGLKVNKFFKDMSVPRDANGQIATPELISGARLKALLRQSFNYPPVDISAANMDDQFFRLYLVQENQDAFNELTGEARPQLYVVFATGQMPYFGNLRPSIEPIGPQTLGVDEAKTVEIDAVDLDNDTLTADVESSDTDIATATVSEGQITITGIGGGLALITVVVDDGRGGTAHTVFAVTVDEPLNNPPVIDAIPAQTLALGIAHNLHIIATDPDGDELTLAAFSSDPSIVSAKILPSGLLSFTTYTEGSAQIMVVADDGRGGTAHMVFDVTVGESLNNPPEIDAIPSRTLDPGEIIDVPYFASDPDGDPLTVSAVSSNPSVATVNDSVPDLLSIMGRTSGKTMITVTVDDGRGGTDTTSFTVTVRQSSNNPPEIDAIPSRTLDPGETIDVPYFASDPDGDPLTVSAVSSNPSVAAVNDSVPGLLSIMGRIPGSATITVTVDDGRGGTDTTSFTVTVGLPIQLIDIAAINTQLLLLDEEYDIPYSVSNPAGDRLNITVSSDTPRVASVTPIAEQSLIRIDCIGKGSATITITLSDESGAIVAQTSFVAKVDSELSLAQTLAVGEELDIRPFGRRNPVAQSTMIDVDSDDLRVVSAQVGAEGVITIRGESVGTVNNTISIATPVAEEKRTFTITVSGTRSL